MRTADDRIQWLEQNFKTRKLTPWKVTGTKGREWVRDHLFVPANGWRICSRANENQTLCDECAAYAGIVTEWTPEIEDQIQGERGPLHDGECPGLDFVAIQAILICLPRREGKTVNLAGLAIERCFFEENTAILYLAAAGEQADRLFDVNFIRPLKNNPDLEGHYTPMIDKLRVEEMNSQIDVVETSKRSITGGGYTLVVVEEARDVDRDVFIRALPSILDQSGLDCVNGHRHPMIRDDSGRPIKKCPTCTKRLRPWFGQIIAVSSAGELDENPKFVWFAEMLTVLAGHKDPRFHMLNLSTSSNPDVAPESKSVLETFARAPSLAAGLEGEMSNMFRTKGDEVIPSTVRLRCVDRTMPIEIEGTSQRCIAFLDTSRVKELTSLVVTADDDGTDQFWGKQNIAALKPWSLLSLVHIKKWDPKKVGHINEKMLVPYLKAFIPKLLGLHELWIDTRGQPWVVAMVENIKNDPECALWSKKVRVYGFGPGKLQTEGRRRAWKALEARYFTRTLRHPNDLDMEREHVGIKRVFDKMGDWDAVDRNRRLMHADILEGLAALCGRAFEILTTKQSTRPSDITRALGKAGVTELNQLFRPMTDGFGGADTY